MNNLPRIVYMNENETMRIVQTEDDIHIEELNGLDAMGRARWTPYTHPVQIIKALKRGYRNAIETYEAATRQLKEKQSLIDQLQEFPPSVIDRKQIKCSCCDTTTETLMSLYNGLICPICSREVLLMLVKSPQEEPISTWIIQCMAARHKMLHKEDAE